MSKQVHVNRYISLVLKREVSKNIAATALQLSISFFPMDTGKRIVLNKWILFIYIHKIHNTNINIVTFHYLHFRTPSVDSGS